MVYAFGEKLRELRKAKSYTLESLGKRIGSSKGYISDIENSNRRPPSDKVVQQIARALGVNKKELMRLAHIDKISEDIKAELQQSEIIPSKEIAEKGQDDFKKVLRQGSRKHQKERLLTIPPGFVAVINNTDGAFPSHFTNLEDLLAQSRDLVQLVIPGTNPLFALRMPDQSMEQKQRPSFAKGSLVFFSAEGLVKEGDCAFVVYQEGDIVVSTFRLLVARPKNEIQLSPLNPRYGKTHTLARRAVKKMWKTLGQFEFTACP